MQNVFDKSLSSLISLEQLLRMFSELPLLRRRDEPTERTVRTDSGDFEDIVF